MKKKKISQEIQDIIDLISNKAGCGIQYNDCPCNTCFHTWAGDIGLSDNISHLLWLALLGIRGDYTEQDLLSAIEDLARDIKLGEAYAKPEKIKKDKK